MTQFFKHYKNNNKVYNLLYNASLDTEQSPITWIPSLFFQHVDTDELVKIGVSSAHNYVVYKSTDKHSTLKGMLVFYYNVESKQHWCRSYSEFFGYVDNQKPRFKSVV